jgi:hypothetical protein
MAKFDILLFGNKSLWMRLLKIKTKTDLETLVCVIASIDKKNQKLYKRVFL